MCNYFPRKMNSCHLLHLDIGHSLMKKIKGHALFTGYHTEYSQIKTASNSIFKLISLEFQTNHIHHLYSYQNQS